MVFQRRSRSKGNYGYLMIWYDRRVFAYCLGAGVLAILGDNILGYLNFL